jgi:hypothetical protein
MVNYGSTPLPYEPFYCYFNATAKNVKELSSDALSEGSIQREKLFFSKKIFVSGTVLSEIGSNAQDTSSASYSGWGNRYNVSSNFKADALILHVKLPEFTLSIISGGSILLKRKVTSDEIETGMILLPSMYFSAGIIYDVLMDFDSTTSCYFTTTAVEGVTTALFRDNSTKNIASYPGAACTLFSIATLTNLVSETLLQIYSKEIVDLNISSSTNEFAIPSKLYAYSNLNNYFNFNNLKKYLDSDFLRIEGSNIKNYKNKAKVSNAANISATAKLYNNELKVIQSKAISIINSSVAAMTATKDFLSIGDSLTEGGRWHDKLKRLIGNKINIAGTVETLQGDTSNYTEGRSGWSLAMYFSMSKSENSYYSPFMHPTSGYYFGIAEKNANELANASTRGGIGKTLQRIGFNSNGYPSNPATNDVVYSIANARYERWNGSAWIDSGLSDSDFSFSVPKYMQAWKISNVDVLYVMLETNDFRTVDPLMVKSTFNSYKENLDVLIASAKEYKSSIVIGIGIANTYCGSDNNNGGYFNTKYTRALWEARKAKINAYDGRESENIYVVDWGAAFDTEFGFDAVNEKPFDDITTTDMLRLDGNTPHPGITNHGYFPMGQMIAAWIASLG